MSSMRRWISGAPMPSGGTGAATCRRIGWPRCATFSTAIDSSCRRSIPQAQARLRPRGAAATIAARRRSPPPSPTPSWPSHGARAAGGADTVLAVAWGALVADGVWQTRREHAGRARLAPVVLQAWQPSIAAGLAVLATTLAGALGLERLTGRLVFRPLAATVG